MMMQMDKYHDLDGGSRYGAELTPEGVLDELECTGLAVGPVRPKVYHAMKDLIERATGCPVVSKTDLAEFARSPYRYHYRKERGIHEETAAMRRGSLIDMLVLTPELFNAEYALIWQPTEEKRVRRKKDGKPYENGEQDPEQKEEWAAARAAYEEQHAGKVFITQRELEEARMVADRALEHLEERGLKRGETFETQVAFFVVVDEVEGKPLEEALIVCGMADILPHAESAYGEEVLDLKSTSVDVTSPHELTKHAEMLLYGVQAALYADHLSCALRFYRGSRESERRFFRFLFAGAGEPVLSVELLMGEEPMGFYRAMYRHLLREMAHAHATGDWGAPTLPTVEYEVSFYAEKKARAELTEGV